MSAARYTEETLVQQTVADYLERWLGWESVYAHHTEDFGPGSLLGRASDREVVLERPLREALAALNPGLPAAAYDGAVRQVTGGSAAQTPVAANRENYELLRTACRSRFAATGARRCGGACGCSTSTSRRTIALCACANCGCAATSTGART